MNLKLKELADGLKFVFNTKERSSNSVDIVSLSLRLKPPKICSLKINIKGKVVVNE